MQKRNCDYPDLHPAHVNSCWKNPASSIVKYGPKKGMLRKAIQNIICYYLQSSDFAKHVVGKFLSNFYYMGKENNLDKIWRNIYIDASF